MRIAVRRSALQAVATALFLCVFCCLSPAQKAENLTNQSIVDLVKNGIESDLIVKMIAEQPNTFDLSSAAIIRLKHEGVSQTVLKAMLNSHTAASQEKQSGEKAPGSHADARSKTANYAWETVNRKDPMTGEDHSTLILESPAVTESGDRIGSFEAQATCTSAELDIHLMYERDIQSADKSESGFKQNTTTYYETGGLFGAIANASHHKKAWTETRVRIGDQSPITATSEADYINESDLYFLNHDPRDTTQEGGGMAFFANVLSANKPAGLSADFYAASRVLFESTFSNGAQSVLEVHPQEPTFRSFAEHCGSIRAASAAQTASAPSDASAGRHTAASYAAPRPGPVASAPRLVIAAGSTLIIALPEAVTLADARSGKLIHANLSSAMQSPAVPQGQQALSLPAGTDIYLRPHILASGQPYQVRLDIDHVAARGTEIRVQANTPTEAVLREKSPEPAAVTLGRYGRFSLPQNQGPKADTIVLKKDERFAFTVSQSTYAPASLAVAQ